MAGGVLMFFARRTPPRTHLSIPQRLFCVGLVLGPPVALGFLGVDAVIRQIDGVLAQSAPLVSAEVSRSLKREVRIGRLESDLTAGGIVGLIRRRAEFGTVPVNAYDIAVANGTTIAGSGLIASARQVTIDLHIPSLLGGQAATGGVPRITLKDSFLLLERYKDGTFNVTKLLPPKEPNQPPSDPFRTYVALENSRVTFRDFQTRVATASSPAVNFIQVGNGFVDLSGSREFRFAAAAQAQAGTVTKKRLAGAIDVSGVLGRGLPLVRPGAPAAESARYLISLNVAGASAAYWLPYFIAVPSFTVTDGVADVDVTLAAPRPPTLGESNPRLGIALGATFRNGRVTAKEFAVPLTDAAGKLDFSDGTLNYDTTARIIGEPVASSGTLWNLTAPEDAAVASGPLPKPQLAVTVKAPRISVQRALAAFLPKTARLPEGLQVSGIATVTAAANGPVNQPIITAVAALPTGQVAFRDLPRLTNLAANITYTQGLLGLTNASAQVVGGGSLRGRLGMQVAPGPSGSATTRGNAVFAARVENVALQNLSQLQGLLAGKNVKRPLRLTGLGSADITGKRVSGALSAAANLRTTGLTLGDIGFPVASARVIYNNGVISLPWARILSPAGAATVRGGVGESGSLSLRFALSSLDLNRLSGALGLQGIGGTLTASGTVSGTVAAPRVTLERAVALNLQYETPAVKGVGGKPDSPSRTFSIDTVTAKNVVATRSDLIINEPILVRRYPAVVSIYGRINNLIPRGGTSSTKPQLALTANVRNLDYAEVLRQLGIEPPIPIAAVGNISAPPLVLPTPNSDAERQRRANSPTRRIVTAAADAVSKAGAAFGGFITDSTLRISGPITSPSVSGAAQLGRLLIGPYPVDGGYIRFAYGPEGASVPEVRLRASVGVVTASASMDKAGELRGTFRAPNLQLAPLSFLVRQVVGVSGDLSVAGTISGNVKNPVLSAQVFPSTITVAGTPLSDVTADLIRVRYSADTKAVDLSIPRLSLSQDGTKIAATGLRYNVANGRFGASLQVETGDIGVLLDTVRRSGLADTPTGAGIVRRLNALPYPIGGTFVFNQLSVSGRLANGVFSERNIVADLQAKDIRVGDYAANTLNAKASLQGDLIRVVTAEIVNQNTTIRGSGTIDLARDGRINVLVESNQASLDLVRAFPGQSGFPVRGQVDVAVIARGLTRQPTITASLEGRDLIVGPPPPAPTPVREGQKALAAVPGVPAPDSATQSAAAPGSAFVISLLRAEGELRQDEANGTYLALPDIIVRSGDNEIRGEVSLPLNFGSSASESVDGLILPDKPLIVRATIGQLDLASLARSLGVEGLDAEGNLTGSVAFGGTLANPALSGGIQLAGGKLRLPKAPGTNRDRVNPISSLDMDVRLSGQTIDVRQLRVALGSPNGQRGEFGSVSTQGTVTLTNLQRTPAPQGGQGRPAAGGARARRGGIQGTTDLRVEFNKLRPVLENISGFLGDSAKGLGEIVRGQIDGTLLVKGPLTTFTVSTPPNKPLLLTNAFAQLPTNPAPESKAGDIPTVNPTLDIAVDFSKGATIASAGTFSLQAAGDVTATGQLFGTSQNALQVQSDIATTGGYLRYGLGEQFNVQRGGDINLRFSASTGLGITVRDLTARQKFYNRNSNAPTLAARASDPTSVFGSTQPPTATRSNGYTITVRVDGPLLLGDQTSGTPGQGGPTLTFTSDPYLSREEILALIGTREQIELAARGNVQGAVSLGVSRLLQSTFVPRLLAPLEGQVATAFGLEEFGLEYNPNAPLTVRFVKRLPDPLDRFLVEYTRSLQTRSQTTAIQPYTFRFSYELYQLRQTRGVLPRLQIGVQLNDQRSFTTFLQGTINY
ncbi:MAG: hypothetical protein V4671_19220 [Armatimonadota bacterium]